jgi:hypothetical protein
MPQYAVTTTVSYTCTDIVDADGEETAKEQAETLTMRWIMRNARGGKANDYGTNKTLHIDQDVVQYITRDEDYKLHT